ncbi:MAG: hypothetical protein ACNI26_13045 [Terasakiella sp.]|uniref:hypothetical protein n=1 Tax=unclassified Terasakiella TaxID=2614952 RepID=UPI003B001426
MFWIISFTIGCLSLLAFRWLVLTNLSLSPLLCRSAIFSAGASFTLFGLAFFFADGDWTYVNPEKFGVAFPLALIINLFIAIGWSGNFLIWTAIGSYLFKCALGSGWLEAAHFIRDDEERTWAPVRERIASEEKAKKKNDLKRREKFERIGRKMGKAAGRIIKH